MSRTFTKLFSSITESTVWCEPDRTRLVWIAMLAMADHAGRVWGSVPGLANRARVPIEDCRTALTAFLTPDPDSRTKDFEGRRIEEIDGGWRLLNHAKYRAIRDEESIKESKRKYINERRKAEREGVEKSRTQSKPVEPCIANAEADTEADTATSKAKATVQPAVARGRFGDFWLAYPVKKGKAAAEKKWRAMKLDPQADQIIAHVRLMQAQDDDWQRGFIPHGSTYINGQRWLDEPTHARRNDAPQQTPSKTMQAIMNLEAMKSENRLAGGRIVDGDAEIALLGFGEATGRGGFTGNGSGMD